MDINEEIISNHIDIDNDMINYHSYLGKKWFFTLKSRETCKKENIKYVKPLDVVLSKSNTQDIVLSRQTDKGYYQFSSMKIEDLEQYWRENHRLYEILREKRKPYFDIEYTANTSEEAKKILQNVRDVIKKSFQNLDVEIHNKDFAMSY